MRAIVTGADGFVGRHLVAHLQACDDDVISLDRHDDEPVDVTDAAAVRVAVEDAAPHVVYHLAAISHVGNAWDAPAHVFRVNAEGTLHVLRACAGANVGRVLVVGSADVYGAVDERDLPLDEHAPLRPITPYGASKAAADVLALQAYLGEQLGTLRVRAFNHTGPGQGPDFLVPALAGRIADAELAGEPTVRVGALEPMRDLSDVRDVVRAYRLLVEHGEPGEAYNVCSGQGVSVGDIARAMLALSDRSLELVVDPVLVRPVEVPRLVGDSAKLHGATGWRPEIPLDQTVAEVLEEARDRIGAQGTRRPRRRA
ncbi:MAG: GDP-mannose 4,6-dehydratase [Actinobacteria bacterium]|nr:GDP-mannose 4,6-dehydratase [Actinomycetota bacterium]